MCSDKWLQCGICWVFVVSMYFWVAHVFVSLCRWLLCIVLSSIISVLVVSLGHLQTQVLADLHLKGMAPVFVNKPFFRVPVVLHPLAAAGIHGGPQEGPLNTVSTYGNFHGERGSQRASWTATSTQG